MTRILWRWSLLIAAPSAVLYSACIEQLPEDGPGQSYGEQAGEETSSSDEEVGSPSGEETNASSGRGGGDGRDPAAGGAGGTSDAQGGSSNGSAEGEAGSTDVGEAAGGAGARRGAGGAPSGGKGGSDATGGRSGVAGEGTGAGGTSASPADGGLGSGGVRRFGRGGSTGTGGRNLAGSSGAGGRQRLGAGGAAAAGDSGVGGATVDGGGASEDDVQFCIDENNRFRATVNLAPLKRNTSIDAFAAEGAAYDYAAKSAHKHFKDSNGVPGSRGSGENEIPGFSGWSIRRQGSVHNVVQQGLAEMWKEGPGGGHYDNMVSTTYTDMGCGIYQADNGDVTVTIDFARY